MPEMPRSLGFDRCLDLRKHKYAITPNATGTGPHFKANLSLPTKAITLITIGAITTYARPALPQGI